MYDADRDRSLVGFTGYAIAHNHLAKSGNRPVYFAHHFHGLRHQRFIITAFSIVTVVPQPCLQTQPNCVIVRLLLFFALQGVVFEHNPLA